MELNTIVIAGTAAAAPEPYHNVYGQENVYALWVDVTRDSGTVDRILVLFQEDKIDGDSFQALPGDYFDGGNLAALIKAGSRVEVTGAIQTYKNMETGRVQPFVWGLYLAAIPEGSQQLNTAYIKGEIARVPVYRQTPKGKYITDLMVRIPSAFAPGFYSYIPCIAWGRLAGQAAELPEGTTVYLEGRVQSREYVKRSQEGDKVLTAWEVSASKLEVEVKDCGNCCCLHCTADCIKVGCKGYPADAPQENYQEAINKCFTGACAYFCYEDETEGE